MKKTQKNKGMAPQNGFVASRSKKPYTTPELVVYGKLADITRSGNGAPIRDFFPPGSVAN